MPPQERRVAHLNLDHAAIADLLRPVWPGAVVQAAEPLSGGFINTNYRVWLTGRDASVVLRVFTRDPAACQKEVDITRLVQSRIPVPDILFADPTGARCGYPFTVTRWVDGERLEAVLAAEDEDAIGAAAYATGATLAAIASFTFAQSGFFGPDLSIPQPFEPARKWVPEYIAGCLFAGQAGTRLGKELAASVWDIVTAHHPLLAEITGPASLVHGDYKGQNLLVRRAGDDWRMAGVLDWEFAYAGSLLFDLGILLRDSAQLPAVYAARILRGLRDGGAHLPANWKAITKLLDLVNLCEFLNAPEPRPVIEAYATARIRETVERWGEYCK